MMGTVVDQEWTYKGAAKVEATLTAVPDSFDARK